MVHQMAPSEEIECENIYKICSFTDIIYNLDSMTVIEDLPQNLPYIPQEFPNPPNLKDLLIETIGNDKFAEVEEVKLKIITRDFGLQHLSGLMPVLRELTLDGSLISSLRDLGCGLKTLRILKVNQCGLTSLDGIYGVKNLEKLYASNNRIRDIIPCTFLENITLIDMNRNELQDIDTLTFLTMCEKLECLILSNNPKVSGIHEYRSRVKSLLPSLKALDHIEFEEYSLIQDCNKAQGMEQRATSGKGRNCKLPPITSHNKSKEGAGESSYSVSFSPKVLSPRSDRDDLTSANIRVHKVELPKI